VREALDEIAARHPDHCERVRGLGMIQGIAWRDPEFGAAISKAAFRRGLIVETCGPDDEVTKLLPPLIIAPDELEQGLSILSDAVDEVTGQAQPARPRRQIRQAGSVS
jgi:diaminobutyrate-2-oxoglutarate transaminase